MNFKNLSSLTALGLGLFLSTTSLKAAQAFDFKTENNESRSGSQSLFSQLRGHNTYKGEPQIEWGDNTLGRIIAKSGDILFIRTEDGSVFHANGGYCPGTDVLVGKNADGGYYLVDRAHSQWISSLESKYGYKRLEGNSQALNERTAAIWAQLKSTPSTATIAPRPVTTTPSTTYTPQPQMQQYNQPIRGLW
ncbi:hypothetical protein [Geminocystis sp. GBBB08]|uniref:hypothetical protein n=1 Tax=Geminocystis sp. GBBB08 TaxID=2604140 RepID=UPI0027E30225|nr:hypothetical protein [Geminocystis sp. GBBB08]MBL1209316.1 hypothetical protein [Geminocystis sp. GBBB08]